MRKTYAQWNRRKRMLLLFLCWHHYFYLLLLFNSIRLLGKYCSTHKYTHTRALFFPNRSRCVPILSWLSIRLNDISIKHWHKQNPYRGIYYRVFHRRRIVCHMSWNEQNPINILLTNCVEFQVYLNQIVDWLEFMQTNSIAKQTLV